MAFGDGPDWPNTDVLDHDLIGDGDIEQEVRLLRMQYLVISVNADENASASIEWTADRDGDDVVVTESASDIDMENIQDDWSRLVRKGPFAQVTITDESGAGSNDTNAYFGGIQ